MNRANLTAEEQALVAYITKHGPRDVNRTEFMWNYLTIAIVLSALAIFFMYYEALGLVVMLLVMYRLYEDVCSVKSYETWRSIVLKYKAALDQESTPVVTRD